ncbi:endonuclease domain-containing protein [Streptomyces sp. NPDC014801]|uniref:endonuclease domain-containing protein n=1 Tax=Streptomyces sp. NPDC014801 TaxID=3364916 RepID=UPI0036FDD51B
MTRERCGKPTKKGTACRRELHSWLEGFKVRRADGCWRHMNPAFRAAAEERKQRDEEAWQAYLAAEPICWSWPVPVHLAGEVRPPTDDVDQQLSSGAIEWLARNPEAQDRILREWQDGRCAICGHRRSLVEDHDHATGLTRGYLCPGCNIQEGIYRSGDNLFSRYRKRHPATILGLQIRYWNPIAGEYAQPGRAMTAAEREADKWTDAASEDIGL